MKQQKWVPARVENVSRQGEIYSNEAVDLARQIYGMGRVLTETI